MNKNGNRYNKRWVMIMMICMNMNKIKNRRVLMRMKMIKSDNIIIYRVYYKNKRQIE